METRHRYFLFSKEVNGRTGCSYQRWFHWKGTGLFVLGSSQGAFHPQMKPDVMIRSAPTKFQFLAASQMFEDKSLLINHVESSFGASMFEYDDLANEDGNLMIKVKSDGNKLGWQLKGFGLQNGMKNQILADERQK